jgi:hypothetical protein
MKNKSKSMKFWLNISLLALIILALQFLSAWLIYDSLPVPREIIGNIFLFGLTGLSFSVFIKFKDKYPDYAGFIFGGLSMAKMILAVVFLLPVLLNSYAKELYFVIQFLIIYVLYLFYESYVLIKLMQSKA